MFSFLTQKVLTKFFFVYHFDKKKTKTSIQNNNIYMNVIK
jgi:hypothetical protein